MQQTLRLLSLRGILIAVLLCSASPAMASWQSWIGAGGGRGGVYQARGGGLADAQFGVRVGKHSVRFMTTVSVDASSSVDPVADVSLLYGRTIHRGSLIVDAMAGPAVLDGPVPGLGLTMGLHISWPAAYVIGFGLMPIISLNGVDSYTGILLQLELGKLR